jgi:calcineurin-like phosphoesterase family protein
MTVKKIIENITPEIRKEMETIWFTADLHHGHPKIVDICNRPVPLPKNFKEYYDENEINPSYNKWKDPEWKNEMNSIHDEWIIKEVFNKYIGRKDTVYILGDLSQAKRVDAEKFIDRLNGNKFLILGNHDKNIQNSTRFSQIIQIKDFTFSRPGINIHIALCHYPMHSWNRKPHGSWHLYGHVHGRYKNPGLSLDVGIDNSEINWRPINLYELTILMGEKERKHSEEVYHDNGWEID